MDSQFKANNSILVTGATGRQGGAVAFHLAAAGWRVRALVRNPGTPAARTLAWKGVELMKGDLNDRPSVDKALRGVYGLFCVLSWREEGVAGEIRQGMGLADAAKAVDLRHVVYSSVGGADRKTGIPHFESKWTIEEHIRGIGLPVTVFRPVFMTYNFSTPNMLASILRGTLTLPMKADRPLQMLAVEDLAEFVNMAFENPDDYLGKATELAGDELTMTEVADVFSRVLGRTVRFVEQPIEEVARRSREIAAMMEWYNRHGYRADINALRVLHPGLMILETWLRTTAGWANAA